MEVLRRSSGINNLQIVLDRQGQPALDAGAGMFRALAFIAMRQQQNQSAQPLPFGFGAGDKLIDDGLGNVPKIAVLRFPED